MTTPTTTEGMSDEITHNYRECEDHKHHNFPDQDFVGIDIYKTGEVVVVVQKGDKTVVLQCHDESEPFKKLTAERDAALAQCAGLWNEIERIADDYHPANANQLALALEEMRNALNLALATDPGNAILARLKTAEERIPLLEAFVAEYAERAESTTKLLSKTLSKLKVAEADSAMLTWIFSRCKIVHWPKGEPFRLSSGDQYSIEHNPTANKDARALLEAARAKGAE